mgnify:CR=1 FL=1
MRGNIKEEKKQMMLNENILTLLPKMAVPTIMAQLITTIYNLVDTFFVSTLGTNATAAVGVNSSLERMITLVGSLIGAGACSYIARLLGAKKDERANQVLSSSFFSGLGLGILFLILGKLIIGDLVYWLGATKECATYSMIGISIGGILNCFLDPLFIYKLGMGVAGASMATAISKFISFVILLVPYIRKSSIVELSIRRIKFIIEDVKEVISIGSSSFFRSLLTVAASIAINRVAGTYSTATLAALSVSNRVMEFPFAFILGFGQEYQPVVGFNWGAKSWKRVKDSYKYGCAMAVAGSVIMGIIIFIFAAPIIYVFNTEADAEVLRLGMLCIRLQCFGLIIHALSSQVNMFYAGIGNAKLSIITNFARQGYCFYPVLFIAPLLFGVEGVASTQAIADLLSAIVIIPLYFYGHKLINKASMEG